MVSPATIPGRPAVAASPTAADSVTVKPTLAVGLALALAVLVAAPWLRQELVACEWLAVAAALLMVDRLRGWLGEACILLAAVTGLAIAFHWAPKVLAYSMRTTYEIGLLFAIPIVLWDAARLALPFWCAGRLVRDPRNAWLPAALVAVATEAVAPGVFPWKLGYSQIAWPVTIQAADIFGSEWAIMAVLWLVRGRQAAGEAVASAASQPAWTPVGIAAVAVVAANAAYGLWAMGHHAEAMRAAPVARVALVQVNPEDEDSVDELRRLTKAAIDRAGPLDLVCWPECSGGSYEDCLRSFADPARVEKHSREPNRGLRPLASPSCPLLFGGSVYRGRREKPLEIFQSAILIDRREDVVGCYHKRHLMPFGEFVPGGDHFPEMRHYFPMDLEYAVGGEPTVLACGGPARLGVMLCYEDMVPGASMSLVRNSANVLISLINGAAFTEPLTLRQHRLLAQMRPVESRRCLLRCAATGETCLISPLGTILATLPLHTKDVLTVDVPLLEGRTVASRIGPAFPLACGGALAGFVLLGRRRRGAAAANDGPLGLTGRP
ncbi:MAG: apolipoprotein N-acyltransferase [Planctomycetia bacterium]|nr:apolipoprotein N-acyltransferase [Planctomycetia bacterium]